MNILSPLKFVTLSELKDMQDPEWLIEGILPMGQTAMLFGKEESFKSFITIDMMGAVTSGRDFHGHKTKKVKGLYVASEGGSPLKKRWKAWEIENNEFNADVELIMDEVINLDRPEEVTHYASVLKEKGFQFIIFDTLRTSVSGEASEGDKTFGAVTKSMRILMRECNATVLVVHHSTKSDDDTYAGWNSLATNSATVMKVKRKDNSPVATLSCTKQKDADRFDTLTFTSKKIEEADSLVMKLTETVPTQKPTKVPTVESRIIDFLRDSTEGSLIAENHEVMSALSLTRDSYNSAVARSSVLHRPKRGYVGIVPNVQAG